MHPNAQDPIFTPCKNIIDEYKKCNESTTYNRTFLCSELFREMNLCMDRETEQIRALNFKRAKEYNEFRDKENKRLFMDWL
jgi:hypothetical protein